MWVSVHLWIDYGCSRWAWEENADHWGNFSNSKYVWNWSSVSVWALHRLEVSNKMPVRNVLCTANLTCSKVTDKVISSFSPVFPESVMEERWIPYKFFLKAMTQGLGSIWAVQHYRYKCVSWALVNQALYAWSSFVKLRVISIYIFSNGWHTKKKYLLKWKKSLVSDRT